MLPGLAYKSWIVVNKTTSKNIKDTNHRYYTSTGNQPAADSQCSRFPILMTETPGILDNNEKQMGTSPSHSTSLVVTGFSPRASKINREKFLCQLHNIIYRFNCFSPAESERAI